LSLVPMCQSPCKHKARIMPQPRRSHQPQPGYNPLAAPHDFQRTPMKHFLPLILITLLGAGLLGRALWMRKQWEQDAQHLSVQRVEWDLDHAPPSAQPPAKPATRAA